MARLEGIFTTSADAGKRLPATTIRGITRAYQRPCPAKQAHVPAHDGPDWDRSRD
jgi:hypothetical protein